MKTIGLIGGMSWESTLRYYRLLNETVQAQLGGLHSAKCVLVTVDFAEVEAMQRQGRWDEAARVMVDAARRLQRAGADMVLIGANTMHKVADAVQGSVEIPLVHIADVTAQAVVAQGYRTVGLLSSRYTMEEGFYTFRLSREHGLRVVLPRPEERELVHGIIYDELCRGNVRQESRMALRDVMGGLVQMGAKGIILGCTELGMLIQPDDATVPLFDTTQLHVEAAVKLALAR